MRKRRISDLEYLFDVAEHVHLHGVDATLRARFDVGRGVALVDAALVRALVDWRLMRSCGAEMLMEVHGRIASRALPDVAREARRMLGR